MSVSVDRQQPQLVTPPAYWLPFGMWYWCKLSDLMACAVRVASLVGMDYNPDLNRLVNKFAALVKPNKIPGHLSPNEVEKKKIFRYSLDGLTLYGVEVPSHGNTPNYRLDPPWTPLNFDPPLTTETFVPEGWSRDVLRAIWKGTPVALDYGEEHGLQGQRNGSDGLAHVVHLDTQNQDVSR